MAMKKSPVVSFFTKKQNVSLLFPVIALFLFLIIARLSPSVGIPGLLMAAGIFTVNSFQGMKRTAVMKNDNDREQTRSRIKEPFNDSTGSGGEIVFCINLNDWRLSYMNPAGEKALGYPARICTRIPGFIFKLLDPHSTQMLKAAVNHFCFSSEKICTLKLGWLSADRRSLLLEVTLIPIRDSNGRLVLLEAIGRYITGYKQRKSYLRNYGDYDCDRLTS